MIIYTKNSVIVTLPYLYAHEDGVYAFPFYGTETYTDPYDGSIWTWENVTNDIDEIVDIILGGINYTRVSSLADCKSLQQSFWWDDTNGYLYVHNIKSRLDVIFGEDERKYAKITSGYASDYNKVTHNTYDNIYYDTRIEDFTDITRVVDPVQLGLISFAELKYDLVNTDSEFDDYTRSESSGSPFFVYATEKDESVSALGQSNQIFQGNHKTSSNNRASLSINGIESRFFGNKPVCRNKMTTDEFANIGDLAGEFKPVAYGQIRRGIAIPTNIDSLTEGSSGTVTLLLADPEIDTIGAVNYVYDKDGNTLSITATDLTNCTVSVTKPSGIAPDETKEYTWQGQGYTISGTYNNGLDIIKSAFLEYNKIIYNSDFFDTTQWAAQTALKTEAVGISVQSEKGWIEEILQPISVSLQGVVEFLGNGKITFFPRKFSGGSATGLNFTDIIEDTEIKITDDVVSEIFVEYAPDFKNDTYLSVLYDDDRSYVVNNYNIETRGNISPLKTVLYNEADAESLAENLMVAYKDPGKYFNLFYDGILDIDLFDLVSFDNKRFKGTVTETITAEVLEIKYNYIGNKTTLRVREYRG